MDLELIGAICSACVLAISQTLTAVKQIKLAKRNKNLQQKLSLAQVLQQLPNSINKAEEIVGEKHGALKKSLVLKDAQIDCSARGLDFDLPGFSNEIEKILDTPQKKKKEIDENGEKSEIE